MNEYEFDDHARGCKGREYTCTCGYDERTDQRMMEAEAQLVSCRAELAGCQAGSAVLRAQLAQVTEEAEEAKAWRDWYSGKAGHNPPAGGDDDQS